MRNWYTVQNRQIRVPCAAACNSRQGEPPSRTMQAAPTSTARQRAGCGCHRGAATHRSLCPRTHNKRGREKWRPKPVDRLFGTLLPPVPNFFLVFPHRLFSYIPCGKLHKRFPRAPPLVVGRKCNPIGDNLQPFNQRPAQQRGKKTHQVPLTAQSNKRSHCTPRSLASRTLPKTAMHELGFLLVRLLSLPSA